MLNMSTGLGYPIKFKCGKAYFNNRDPKAVGHTFIHMSMDSIGPIAFIRPRDFRRLVNLMTKGRNVPKKGHTLKSVKNIAKRIKAGKPLASLMLEVRFDESGMEARVVDHEGRHRALVLDALQPEILVPMCVIPLQNHDGLIQDLKDTHIQTLLGSITSQTGNKTPTNIKKLIWKGRVFYG